MKLVYVPSFKCTNAGPTISTPSSSDAARSYTDVRSTSWCPATQLISKSGASRPTRSSCQTAKFTAPVTTSTMPASRTPMRACTSVPEHRTDVAPEPGQVDNRLITRQGPVVLDARSVVGEPGPVADEGPELIGSCCVQAEERLHRRDPGACPRVRVSRVGQLLAE